jgi:hypothetical protein
MKLSKIIPERVETIEFRWIRKDWLTAKQFNDSRAMVNLSLTTHCYWCNHKFEDDEYMAIGGAKRQVNRIICQSCADEALKEGKAND